MTFRNAVLAAAAVLLLSASAHADAPQGVKPCPQDKTATGGGGGTVPPTVQAGSRGDANGATTDQHKDTSGGWREAQAAGACN